MSSRDLGRDCEDTDSPQVQQLGAVREDEGEKAHPSAQLEQMDSAAITEGTASEHTPTTPDMQTPPETPMSHVHSIFEDVGPRLCGSMRP